MDGTWKGRLFAMLCLVGLLCGCSTESTSSADHAAVEAFNDAIARCQALRPGNSNPCEVREPDGGAPRDPVDPAVRRTLEQLCAAIGRVNEDHLGHIEAHQVDRASVTCAGDGAMVTVARSGKHRAEGCTELDGNLPCQVLDDGSKLLDMSNDLADATAHDFPDGGMIYIQIVRAEGHDPVTMDLLRDIDREIEVLLEIR